MAKYPAYADVENGLQDGIGEKTTLIERSTSFENLPNITTFSWNWDVLQGQKSNKIARQKSNKIASGRSIPKMYHSKRKKRFCFKILKNDGSYDLSNPAEVVLSKDDEVSFRVLRQQSRDDDDIYISACPQFFKPKEFDDSTWVDKYELPIEDVDVVESKGKKVKLSFHRNASQYQTLVTFQDQESASSFLLSLQNLKSQKKALAENILSQKEILINKKYLVDIGSARNIWQESSTIKCDPYCIVRIGSQEIHRTKHIPNCNEPVWTILTDSLFIFEIRKYELIQKGLTAMTFELMDYQAMGNDIFLGCATLPLPDLMNSSDKVITLYLKNSTSIKGKQGCLELRCRKATDEDIMFMERGEGLESVLYLRDSVRETHLQPPAYFACPPRLKKKDLQKLRSKHDIKYNVTPPDTLLGGKAQLMSLKELDEMVQQPSRSWIQAGSGSHAFLFVEVLGCDGLPNLDLLSLDRSDKTDAFVTVIFEDVMVSTTTFENSLNPRYMPWLRRAFMFNVNHLSSALHLSVHDHDHHSHHDYVGKVAISLLNFKPNIEYVLTYNLHSSTRRTPRVPQGSITIRLSIEFINRNIHRAFYPSITNNINAETKKDYRIAKHTLIGKPNFLPYHIPQIMQYKDELLVCLLGVLLDVYDSVTSVIFWRSRIRILTVSSFDLKLPLHSMFFFACAILIYQDVRFVPVTISGTIVWIMLAQLEHTNKHSSYWGRRLSYVEQLQIHCLGRELCAGGEVRAPAEESSLSDDYAKARQERINDFKERSMEKIKLVQSYFMLRYKEVMVDYDEDSKINPLRPYLFPVQQVLGFFCDVKRMLEQIFSWQRSDTAFAITTCAFVFSVVNIFIPWEVILRWIGRGIQISFLLFLGPWMMLVDLLFNSERERKKVEEGLDRVRKKLHQRKEAYEKYSDMIKYLFGKYVVSIPASMPLEHFYDTPLPSSHGKYLPKGKKRSQEIHVQNHVMGVDFELNMLPTINPDYAYTN